MKRMLAICMSTALFLTACSQRPVLKIAEQGSFAIGGKVLTDSLGHTYHGDHAYVFFQKPVAARKYPLVFAHGVGQFSKTWETTPDGREGFQNIFLRRGFSTYPRRSAPTGKCGTGNGTRRHYSCLRRGNMVQPLSGRYLADYFEGVQFSRDPGALDQFFRQMTPNIGPVDFEVYSDGYAALFDKVGPAVFVTHSQGGRWAGSRCCKTKNIRAIVSYEPGGRCRSPKGKCRKRGNTSPVPIPAKGIEVSMDVFMGYTKIPILIYYGDNLPETDERPELYEWTRRPASDAQVGGFAQ